MPVLPILSLLWGGFSKFIGKLFTFFTTKPGCYIGMVLAVLVALWLVDNRAYNSGIAFQKRDEATRVVAAQIEAFQAGIKKQTELDRGLIAAADKAGFLRGKAQAETIILTREVAKYVTPEIDRTFPVACAVIRMHDAAALRKTAADLGEGWCGPDGTVAEVKASDLSNLIVENYGLYWQAAAQVIGLQDAMRAMAKALGAELEIVQGSGQVSRFDVDQPKFDQAEQQPVDGEAKGGALAQGGDGFSDQQHQHVALNGLAGP